MTSIDRLERELPRLLEERYLGPRPSYADAALRVATTARRSTGHPNAAYAVPVTQLSAGLTRAPRARWALIAAIALLILALATGAAFVGRSRQVLPALTTPAANGLVAYSTGGDIYVGDAASGTTTAIVVGPELDSRPIFSPDGSQIAFLRGDQWGADSSVLVVRADGSDTRVAMPAGYSNRGVGFAWTPDGRSLAAQVDAGVQATPYFDGELALLDASGLAGPRLLTPPFPMIPGAPYFNVSNGMAGLIRPPNGDRLLSHGDGSLTERDLTGRFLKEFIPASMRDEFRFTHSPTWSPDGSVFAFNVDHDLYVVNADGSRLHRIGTGWSPAWSPDGKRIACVRFSGDLDALEAAIVVVDAVTAADRVLGATSVGTKTEGGLATGSGSDELKSREWQYEGWSWTPDGQGIVWLERHGERPKVVDVASGHVTELPWESDSAPSWRRPLPG